MYLQNLFNRIAVFFQPTIVNSSYGLWNQGQTVDILA